MARKSVLLPNSSNPPLTAVALEQPTGLGGLAINAPASPLSMVKILYAEGPRDDRLATPSEHCTSNTWTMTGLAPPYPLLLVSGAEEKRDAGENFQLDSLGSEEQPLTGAWSIDAMRSPLSETSSSSQETLEADEFAPNTLPPMGV